MKATAKVNIGGTEFCFEVEEKDEMDTLNKIITFGNPRFYCDACKNTDQDSFYLTTNKDTEGNTYVNMKCKCGARSKLGRYKTGGFFWHKYEVYVPEDKGADKD